MASVASKPKGSQFSDIFNAKPKEFPEQDVDATRTAPKTTPRQDAKNGRRLAKRVDPEWRQFNFFLKTKTHLDASILLKQMQDGRDLSDVVQDVLQAWVRSNTA